MRFTFMPREPAYLGLLDEMSSEVRRSAARFLVMVQQFDDLDERASDLKRREEVCDRLVATIIESLDRAFITPIDREDVHALTTRLDDVIDTMEEAAHRFLSFRSDPPTAPAIALARIVDECCGHIEPAIRLCRDRRRAGEIQEHVREINRLEKEADRIYREADAELFASATDDILSLIKWRELYAWLEDTVDACKEVAQVLSEIVIKAR